ncbi:unnamed protein product [Cyprideis torosa]|uniref:Complex I assembly factor TIMMDC1, mitochondrial n=1 Tax=Cyprideis torosa TaxID=163714 RepID=A0A7R8ZND5_9CRUS|nr:unnamed protein product [Cyprideis torosa]CAG0886086.1 unnamed protein product [Cyprideis torosa]
MISLWMDAFKGNGQGCKVKCWIPLISSSAGDTPSDIEMRKKFLEEMVRRMDEMTAWERLQLLFKLDDYGNLHPELFAVKDGFFVGALVGAVGGGFKYANEAYTKFLRTHNAEMFQSFQQANRKMQDTVLLAFAKGAVTWGSKIGIFSALFFTFSTIITVVRNKAGFMEFPIAGAATGALFNLSQGLLAAYSGSIVGMILGCVPGVVNLSQAYVTNISIQEKRMWAYNNFIKETRDKMDAFEGGRTQRDIWSKLETAHDHALKTARARMEQEATMLSRKAQLEDESPSTDPVEKSEGQTEKKKSSMDVAVEQAKALRLKTER